MAKIVLILPAFTLNSVPPEIETIRLNTIFSQLKTNYRVAKDQLYDCKVNLQP